MKRKYLKRLPNCKVRLPLIKSIYNVQTVSKEIKEEENIYVVRKMEEAKLLNKLGFVATVITSRTSNFLKNYGEYFKSAKVIILYENGEKEAAEKIKKELEDYTYAIKVVLLSSKYNVGLNKILEDEYELNKLQQKIKDTEWRYAKWVIRESKGYGGKIKEKINQGILKREIKKTLKYEVIGDGSSEKVVLYMYRKGVYEEISLRTLRAYVEEYIPTHLVTDSIISSVVNLFSSKKEAKEYSILDGKEHIINFKNGLYNVETDSLMEHTPNYITKNQFNVNFIRKPFNNNHWDKFIDTFTMGDNELRNILQEWVGLILSNYNGSLVKKMLILYGEGDTGKSKIIELLVKLLGEKRTKVIELENLTERFALGDIARIRLIHSAELSTNKIGAYAVSKLKKLTGEDMLPSEKKYLDNINAEFKGVLVYGANELPGINANVLKPIFNRLMFIPCKNVIASDKQDPYLVNKLLEDKEYIFQWALEGLKRLKNNNFKFSYSKEAEMIKNQYEDEVDNVRLFIDDNCTKTKNCKDRIKTTELYDIYKNWCEINSYDLCSKKDFRIRVCNNGFTYNRKFQGYPMYEGLKLKQVEENINI